MENVRREFMEGAEWSHIDLGFCGHTALRKCCDSDATSLVYNLAHGLDAEWELFLRMLEAAIRDGRVDVAETDTMSVSLAAWVERARDWAHDDYPSAEVFVQKPLDTSEKAAGPIESLYRALLCSLSLFDAADWRGFVTYYF